MEPTSRASSSEGRRKISPGNLRDRPMHAIYGPFDPGQSPFKTKGTAYVGINERFEVRLAGGFDAVLERVEDPRVRSFFAQRFLPSSMYDVLPLVEAAQIGAKIVGQSWREFVREGAALQAEKDMRGVYRMLLCVASPQLVVERLPRMLVRYFDFGKVVGEFNGSNRYEAVLTGIPKTVGPWLQGVAEGFIPAVMATSGARQTSVIMHPFEFEADGPGMDFTTTRLSVTWV